MIALTVLLVDPIGDRPLRAADLVRISVANQNISFLPAGVALSKSCLKHEELEVELIRMNTPNTITALMTGDIGYTLLLGSVIRGALRGSPGACYRNSHGQP